MSEPSKRARKPSKAWLRSKGLPTDSEDESESGSGKSDDDDSAARGSVSHLDTAPTLSLPNVVFTAPAATLSVPALSRQNSASSISATTPAASSQPSTRPSTPSATQVETVLTADLSRRAAFEKRYANMTDEEILGT